MKDLEKRLEIALKEIERLNQENSQLKQRLADILNNGPDLIDISHPPILNDALMAKDTFTRIEYEKGTIYNYSTPSEKIALFRSLFRGREDVFPKRWEGKTGKSGYSPACKNEWSSVCKKPQIKCSDCSHREFLPITDEVISNHLNAKINRTIGVYPMLEDETCWFLAIDFDKQNWKLDAAAVMDLKVPAALERSRSGNGGHIWIFFDRPLEASLARKLGCALLTKTMENRYELGLDSYDRLFPNQDTMPKGGFGNLIALPLQGGPRKEGNSVFVDEYFTPYEDQWRFLSGLRKMTLSQVEAKVHELTRNSKVLNVSLWDEEMDEDRPWEKQQLDFEEARVDIALPSKVHLTLSNMIYIEKNGIPARIINQIRRLASFQNPDFYKTQAMRLPTYGKPRVIGCAEDFPNHIALPRGCLQLVENLFGKYGVELSIADERNKGIEVDVNFIGQLSILQDAAARSILAHETGILSATTAFGKTVVGASIIASRKVNTLVLVHRRELMDQWKERLSTFLDLATKDIGVIGGGKEKRTGIIDIAVIQSLNNKGQIKEYLTEYGQIMIDECHHISAFSFEQVLKKASAKYVVGLTATPTRQDGQQPIVLMQCGPIRTKIDAKSQAFARGFEHKVLPRYTSFQLPLQMANPSIQTIYQLLVEDEKRNELIFDDLLKCLDQGRSPLLLTERTAHVEYFEKKLEKFAKNVIVLRGGMGKKQREELRQRIAGIPNTEERVFIATGKLIGEGFDDARLDTLFLVHPISWKGNLQQYAGRLHRSHANKQDVQIYDDVDIQVPLLMSMYRKRIKGFRAMGYSGMEL
ncbi:TOTE conflict system archaeo-eukaryotic primase domain-containing protein [Paenibacillus sp. OAS669]|uniref:TOTE conflict system archaeo-eukaryotic primase domain-containing protein n=1 Tax=Paenibacillus sp. OAS669 TaxID=2663821 RepID=UPI00178BCE8F|nr:DEAD/DEAH box helicase [Paenibacillus sp. OAS669]MBE1446130.1 superfamily II DNA or RNA helicase [Paenibacillus sp. OAS669]